MDLHFNLHFAVEWLFDLLFANNLEWKLLILVFSYKFVEYEMLFVTFIRIFFFVAYVLNNSSLIFVIRTLHVTFYIFIVVILRALDITIDVFGVTICIWMVSSTVYYLLRTFNHRVDQRISIIVIRSVVRLFINQLWLAKIRLLTRHWIYSNALFSCATLIHNRLPTTIALLRKGFYLRVIVPHLNCFIVITFTGLHIRSWLILRATAHS